MAYRKITLTVIFGIGAVTSCIGISFSLITPLHWELVVRKNIYSSTAQLRSDAFQILKTFATTDDINLKLCGKQLPNAFRNLERDILGESGEICVWLRKYEPDIAILVIQGVSTRYYIIVPELTDDSLKQVKLNGVYKAGNLTGLTQITPYVYEVNRLSGI